MNLRKPALLLLIPLLLLVLLLTTLIAGAAWLLHTESGAGWALKQARTALNQQLSWDELDGDLAAGLHIRGMRFDNESTRMLTHEAQLTLKLSLWPPVVRIPKLGITDLDILRHESQAGLEKENGVLDIEQTLRGLASPIKVQIEDLTISGLSVSTGTDDKPFLAERLAAALELHNYLRIDRLRLEMPQARLSLQAELFLLEPFQTGMDFELAMDDGTSLQGSISGELDQLDLSVSGQVSQEDLGALQAEFTGSGNLDGLVVERLDIEGDGLLLSANGFITLQPQLSLQLQSQIEHFNPAGFVPDWPGQHPLSGEFSLTYEADEGLSAIGIPALQLRLTGTDAQLGGNAEINLDAGRVVGNLNWTRLAWPPGSDSPKFSSPEGAITLNGSPGDWNAVGEMSLEFTGLPPGSVRMDSQGNADGAQINILDSAVLGGSVSGTLEYSWREAQPWTATLATVGINPAALLPDWPGSVDMQLNAAGQVEPKQFQLHIIQLEGMLRDRDVTASGRVAGVENALEFDDLRLQAGEASITLDGALERNHGLAVSADIDSLTWFLSPYREDISGSLQGTAVVTWKPQLKALQLNLEGTGLQWDGLALETLSLHSEPDTTGAAPASAGPAADLVLKASGISRDDLTLDTVRLDLVLRPDRQDLALSAESAGNQLQATFSGALDNWKHPTTGTWTGILESLSLTGAEPLSLELEAPADLTLSSSRASLAESCLDGVMDTRLCLDADWSNPEGLRSDLRLDALPVDLVRLFLDTEMEFTQILSGVLHWRQPPDKSPTARLMVNISPGQIHYLDDPQDGVMTSEGILAFDYDNGQLSAGQLDLGFPGSGQIDIDFKVGDVTLGAEAILDGRAIVKLDHLRMLPGMVPFIDRASGKVDAEIEILGTLATPQMGGNVLLIDASFENLAAGLKLSNVQLDGQLYEDRHADLRGSFNAGEGKGDFFASADLSDMMSPRLELGISGKNLNVVDVPDLHVIVDPDLRLGWQGGILNVDGSLFVPSARIAPASMPAPVSRESSDLTIVAGAPPETTQAPSLAEMTKVRGQLELRLGKDVEVDLDVAKANLGGSVNFSWLEGYIPVANGIFTVAGRIQAFGQSLNITQGKISFPDIPADNPHFNIRAERDIYGNTQVRTAGLFVAGTLKRPLIEPYTVPMTNRDRAQTLLVTGSDFNYEQGVGAVDVGMYIAPRLFISYGIGLFDNENVISARYDLRRGFGIKATSGQRTSGLDVSYTLEH